MLTDGQFAALLTVVTAGFAALAGAVRWGAGRVTKSIDRNTDAMLGNTESNAGLSAKIDIVAAYVGMRDRVEAAAAPATKKRAATAPATSAAVDDSDS